MNGVIRLDVRACYKGQPRRHRPLRRQSALHRTKAHILRVATQASPDSGLQVFQGPLKKWIRPD